MDRPGTRHIGLGLLWLVGGLTVSFLSYAATKTHGGGLYLVASGAIFWGFLEFLYGVVVYGLDKIRNQYRGQINVGSTPKNKIVQSPPRSVPLQPQVPTLRDDQRNKWTALVKYDDDIAKAAEQLRPYGEGWITILGRDYFALGEDKKYMPSMVRKLIDDAEEINAKAWTDRFEILNNKEFCTP